MQIELEKILNDQKITGPIRVLGGGGGGRCRKGLASAGCKILFVSNECTIQYKKRYCSGAKIFLTFLFYSSHKKNVLIDYGKKNV